MSMVVTSMIPVCLKICGIYFRSWHYKLEYTKHKLKKIQIKLLGSAVPNNIIITSANSFKNKLDKFLKRLHKSNHIYNKI